MKEDGLSQQVVNEMVASANKGKPAKSSIDSLLEWLEGDGEKLKQAWEKYGELLVVDWAEFTKAYANDSYVADCLGVESSSLDDDQRIEVFNQCIDNALEDASSSLTVHLKELVATSNARATIALLARLEGYSQALTFLGVYPTVTAAIADLPRLGYQIINNYPSRELILRSWQANKLSRKPGAYVFPDVGNASVAWVGQRFMFIEVNPEEPYVGADYLTEYAQPNFQYLLLDGLECSEIGWARPTKGGGLECGLLDVHGTQLVANFGAAAKLLGRRWEKLKRDLER